MASDDDCPLMVGNLQKARQKWAWMLQILGREGANVQVLGKFFKALVWVVLLLGSETWVMTPHMLRALGGGFNIGWPAVPRERNHGGSSMEVGSKNSWSK